MSIRWTGLRLVIFVVCCLVVASLAEAEDWGNLKARFVYGGDPPARKPIKITTDKDYCGKCELYEEQLVVDKASRGVANVVAWLYLSRNDPQPRIHESYAESATHEVLLDSTKCRVDPHVSLFRTSQKLLLRNTDPIGDGLKIDPFKNTPINILLPPDGEKRCVLTVAERLPIRVSCPVHPWESGWLLVQEHPYMAVSDKEGRLEILNLPCGRWTIQFWHELAGYVSEVKVAGKMTSWKRGRVEITIAPGSNDLGEVEMDPAVFQ